MNIGNRIKNRRLELGLSVEDVAARLNKNRATIYRYESNEIENLPTTVLEPLAEILQTTPAFLMGWEDDPFDYDNYEGYIHPMFDGDAKKQIAFEKAVDEGVEQEQIEVYKHAQEHLKKYTRLDKHGKQIVDTITDIEYERITGLNEQAATYDFPLLGKTAAGIPLEYSDPSFNTVTVHDVPKGAKFALCVAGDSMEPIIPDGSIVFVKPQPVAENGEIVVVEIDGAVTCKKIHKEDGKIEFRSINPKYKPITKFENIRIIGKVVL